MSKSSRLQETSRCILLLRYSSLFSSLVFASLLPLVALLEQEVERTTAFLEEEPTKTMMIHLKLPHVAF